MLRALVGLALGFVLFHAATNAHAQCVLANPSFELAGSGGPVFGGWNQFGAVGSSTTASHGSAAAQVTGPNQGAWGVSAYWQRMDTVPGEQWSASVCVSPSSSQPLTGPSTAILNMEWRDAAGLLISYESHTVADASSPQDEYAVFNVISQPAPAGAVATHFLVGVLQGPNQPAPQVLFDQAVFEKTGPPTPDDLQWVDFPGGRTLDFSGYSWRVKGPGLYAPGPNLFCDTANCTWVDGAGRLHLTMQNIAGSWYSTELVLTDALSYGDYVFTTVGRVDNLHPNVVLGLFLWEYRACYLAANDWWSPYNEIDIELSRWGNVNNFPAQFVAQPYDFPGNIDRFNFTLSDGELSSHAFRWLPDRIEFRSWRGGQGDESPANLIHQWTYTGPHIPRPERPRVHLNLWYAGSPPTSDQEVVLDAFSFTAACVGAHCDSTQTGVPPGFRQTALTHAAPNPFRSSTRIRFSLESAAAVHLTVFDAAGRKVSTLAEGTLPAGDHERIWRGRDANGKPVASGVYFYRFQSGDVIETRRLVLLR